MLHHQESNWFVFKMSSFDILLKLEIFDQPIRFFFTTNQTVEFATICKQSLMIWEVLCVSWINSFSSPKLKERCHFWFISWKCFLLLLSTDKIRPKGIVFNTLSVCVIGLRTELQEWIQEKMTIYFHHLNGEVFRIHGLFYLTDYTAFQYSVIFKQKYSLRFRASFENCSRKT